LASPSQQEFGERAWEVRDSVKKSLYPEKTKASGLAKEIELHFQFGTDLQFFAALVACG
jgi:hypothetical protein